MASPAHIEATHHSSTGPEIVRQATEQLREHWAKFAVEGAAMAAIGILIAVLPQVGTLATVVIIGWCLFVAGLLGILAAIGARSAPGYWSSLGLSLLTGLLGVVLAMQPFAAELTLTTVLVAYFLAHAAGMVGLAITMRHGTGRWPSLALGALIDLALAAIVISGWPGTATWVIGLMVGLNLAFAGLALAFAAIGARAER